MDGRDEPAEESALDWIAENAVDSEALPDDLADRHDYYLYGYSSENRNDIPFRETILP